ncbi:transglycosylase domain-containing protein [Enterococcus quebecensis]|uniref:Transglycosylase n=1 Tax=Enterococcus quebecensis TaxID=903983 RepID=A0A1E5H3E1_9ENTE|nr:transglycosylase domain-containing protein [Enterococcus quebecensis]OEG19423.1 transglycosylase [Enterococcus quebecensis]OJG75305.1 penicillin-binding protein 1B [Enterococcus quebecensis]
MYHYIEVKLLDNRNNSHKTEQYSHKVPEKKKIFLIINVVIRVLQSLFVFAVVMILLGGSLGLGIGMGYFAFLVEDTKPPTKEELQTEISDITEVSKMTYADGTNIAMIKSDLVRTRVDGEHISPLLKKAIISTEDEYFEEHKGVVPKAVIRALVSDATGLGGSSGGSTLTQQLVKQQILTDETTFKRKATEILLAYRIEKYFSKDEIVTTYLNVSPFGRNNKGENVAGVEEAAKGLFGKSANDLTLPQAAFIAGLPQSPIIYTPYSNTGALKSDENLSYGMKRKDFVLFSMYREKAITKEEYETAKNYDLKQDFQPQQESNQNTEGYLYYAVMDQAAKVIMDVNIEKAGVKKETLDDLGLSQYEDQARREIQNRGYTIHSTIDQTVYDTMQNAVANFGYMLDDGYGAGLVETGNVLMDNKTGKIIGFVAGRDYNVSQSNHALNTTRQVGSTIKPISVYGPAIDQGMIGSESRLANYPTSYSGGDELTNATNSGTNTFDTVRHSLEWSYNIPVYHLNEAMKKQMGDDNFSYNNYLSKMNYPPKNDWAYESAPLGTVEATVLTQTNGFQTLANKGQYQKGYMIDKITDNSGKVIYEHKETPVQVYSQATASIMNDMMRSVLDSKITTPFKNMVSGLNPALGNIDWIGKTGTTDSYVDAWLVVSTPTITLGSWTGYDIPTAMSPNSGDQNSVYLANLANAIYSVRPDLFGNGEKFTLSNDVIKSNVSSFTGEKPGTFTYNGGTYTAPGPNVVSFYAKDGAPKGQYKFGYGGSDANYSAYWSRYAAPSNSGTTPSSSNSGQSTTPSSSEKKEDTKKDEDKKENVTPSSSRNNNN